MKKVLTVTILGFILASCSINSLAQGASKAWKIVYLEMPHDYGCMSPEEEPKLRKKLLEEYDPPPKDIAGLILKGFRKLFGMESKHIIDLFNCLPMIKGMSFNSSPPEKDCQNPQKMCSQDSLRIQVKIKSIDRDTDPLTYSYKTTGGKIIGVGSTVIWELPKNISKTYAIEVCANDGFECKKNVNIASAHIYVVDY